ncbi:TlpA disulfide reductase family protein [Sphingobacterium sp. 1.A.5]|uniref:TlpA family protein disulfide reductase n=1 Tax=Sphingobacterium sp. 1.A.5 TaxID=2044604 RepID=UPI000C0BC946|nr:TlpA disulfide reductase family protein [Sphingobacterium sp. 1.A.5]
MKTLTKPKLLIIPMLWYLESIQSKFDGISYWSTFRTTFLSILFLLISFSIQAQSGSPFQKPSSKSLYVGDQIPEEFYELKLNTIDLKKGNLSQIQLKDHRSKLIILDFWATWCPSCLGSLKHLHEIRSVLDTSKVLVLPVNYQKPEEIKIIIDRFGWDHRSVHSDIDLGAYFPHQGIPHMVWIKDSKVHSMPMISYATADNINRVLENKKVNLLELDRVKIPDFSVPLLYNKDIETKVKYRDEHLTITGYIPDFETLDLERTETKDSIFIHMVNVPIGHLLYRCFQSQISPYFFEYKGAITFDLDSLSQRLLQTSRPTYSEDANYQQDLKVRVWEMESWVSMDFRVPKSTPDSAVGNLLRSSLQKYLLSELGWQTSIRKSPLKTYPRQIALVSLEQLEKVFSKPLPIAQSLEHDGNLLYRDYTISKWNKLISHLMGLVNDRDLDYTTITDDSEFPPQKNIQFQVPRSFFERKEITFDELLDFMKEYGMSLEIKKAQMDYLHVESIRKPK